MGNGLRLTTDRLVLRPGQADDVVALHAIACDYDVVSQTGDWPWPADRAFTTARCRTGFSGGNGWLVAQAGPDIVGGIGIKPTGDIGYLLARAHWGRGYATEMGHALVTHVFAHGMHDRLSACVFTDNPASARVLEKLGFAEGAPCRGQCVARGGEFPTRTFTCDRPHRG